MSVEKYLEDLELFKDLDCFGPKNKFYEYKLTTDIKQAYGLGQLDNITKELILNKQHEVLGKRNGLSEVFLEFQKYTKDNNFILNYSNFEALCTCLQVCEALGEFSDARVLSNLTSSQVLVNSIKTLFDECKQMMTDKLNDKLFVNMEMLFRNLVYCHNNLGEDSLVKEMLQTYFEWQYELLEYFKNFYYMPKFYKSKKLDYYSQELIEQYNPNDYVNYYKQKYLLQSEENYFFPNSQELISLEDLGLSSEDVSFIKISVINTITNLRKGYSSLDVIKSYSYNRIEYLTYFSYDLLLDTICLANDFSKMLKDTKLLLSYMLQCADVLSASTGDVETYNGTLKNYLVLLVQCDKISSEKCLSLFEEYRR